MTAREDTELVAVDTRRMALVVTIDADGNSRVVSGLGYTKRQQAAMMRQLAAAAERQADEAGEES